MSAKDVDRIEKIAFGDILGPKPSHNKTLKRIRHWQRRIWKAASK